MDNPSGASAINMVDIGVIAVLLISALLAYARGLVHEVLALAAWIGAIFATLYGFPFLQPYARKLTTIDIVADLGAGVVIFVVSLVLLSMLTRRISKKVRASALNAVDRSLGFLFGLARGALVVCIAYIGLELVYPKDDQPEMVRQARALELVEPGAEILTSLIPENLSAVGTAFGDDGKEDAGAGEDAGTGKDPGSRRVVQDLLAPKPKSGKNGADAGYGKKERQGMERLHDSLQKP
ncbi:MAG: CvpA family protein [Proteobacteria bacterium]|nr:CvpA family protein [Pseudomonadota bacterium]MCH8237392.1 CvpA family protein [Pseudomonadota bacterium]